MANNPQISPWASAPGIALRNPIVISDYSVTIAIYPFASSALVSIPSFSQISLLYSSVFKILLYSPKDNSITEEMFFSQMEAAMQWNADMIVFPEPTSP